MTSPNGTDTAEAWISRLERRLSKLADTASKESIQALAKWIGFRRKYAKQFSACLANAIETPASLEASHSNREARQWLYLQILHESILLDSGTSRWDRLEEMREILGEFCMMEVAKRGCLDAAMITKVEGLLKQWDGLNVFGVPTLITMIKKQLTSAPQPPTTTTTTTTTEPSGAKSPPRSPKRTRSPSPKPDSKKESQSTETTPMEVEPKEETKKKEEVSPSATKKSPQIKPPTPSKSPKKDLVYDFESKNIPQGKVDAKEFLDPCKAIATFQIARDLRNDNAVQVSSLLKTLPKEVQDLYEQADEQVKETGEPYELPDKKARELSVKTSERLLDMDIEEQIQNVRTFMELVEKQREARQRLIYLLIRSRCQFGSKEAAESFYGLDKIEVELQKRKDTLMDAMELEGLDFEEEKGDDEKNKKKKREFPPFTWYENEKNSNSNDDSQEPNTKRAKADSN